MEYLYLLLNLSSISIPLIASFHPRLQFYKKWKSLFAAIALTSIFFVTWDILFTEWGIWGFNSRYYLGYKIVGLPIEEWLFFICIPYACIFMHYSLLELFPKLKYPDALFKIFKYSIVTLLIIMCILFHDRWYTMINFIYAILLIVLVNEVKPLLLKRFIFTFILMLIPFFIINGILTGSWIEEQVVWYNDLENIGVRLGTIPVEDIIYAFTLVLSNIILLEYFERNKENKTSEIL